MNRLMLSDKPKIASAWISQKTQRGATKCRMPTESGYLGEFFHPYLRNSAGLEIKATSRKCFAHPYNEYTCEHVTRSVVWVRIQASGNKSIYKSIRTGPLSRADGAHTERVSHEGAGQLPSFYRKGKRKGGVRYPFGLSLRRTLGVRADWGKYIGKTIVIETNNAIVIAR